MAGQRTRGWGQLESEIVAILRAEEASQGVKDIQGALDGHIPAYTTIMTALDRLVKKGEVIREVDSPRRIRFRPARSGEEHASREMLSALDGADDRESALLKFAGNLTNDDAHLLREAIMTSRRRNRR